MENRNINVILTLSQSEQTYLEEYAGKVHLSLEDLVMLAIISLERLGGEKENAFIIRSPLGL